jgi:large subunit ribosomal protein L22
MRLVVDLIRGKSVNDALHILHYSPHAASKVAEKVVRSAVANLQNKDGGGRVEPDQMTVREAFVDVGMTVKRISPAPMGRGYRIRKRSNHVTVVVETSAGAAVAKAKRPAGAAKAAASKKPAAPKTPKAAAAETK